MTTTNDLPSTPSLFSLEDELVNTVAARRGEAAIAGHVGDEEGARHYLDDAEPSVRAAAFDSLVRMGAATPDDVTSAMADTDPVVRRSVCEHGASLGDVDLTTLLSDGDETVIEAAAYALGHIGDRRAVPALCKIASTHEILRCRESAVAALGTIADESGKATIVSALEDKPSVRMRAVIALSSFQGDDVAQALRARLKDPDWLVRQAAEDALGASAESIR